ncbi:MAG: hypothetical protein GC204_01675 [Chloroflexi bacterium]|nr:hypothetical protein [Chloroflexota bacterium]
MDIQTVQIIAGSISSFFFISSNLPMLLKAFKTRDLRSYSLSNILLNNVGNVIYWLYVSSLPLGPIWVMHSFYTLTSLLMLVAFVRYEYKAETRNRSFFLVHRS